MSKLVRSFVDNALVINPDETFHVEGDQGYIKTEQTLPQRFLTKLKEQAALPRRFAPDEVKMAEIPTSVVDHWYRQGFDINRATASEIQQKLIKDGLTDFLTTDMTF